MAKIKDYIPILKQNIIPAMMETYNINFKLEPIMLRPTSVSYMGFDKSENRIILEFNSEYRDNGKPLLQNNQLFSTVFFGFAGTKAGVLDITNTQESIEILYSALYELGFRTEQDIQDDKDKAEKEKQEKQQAKEREIQQAREKEKARHELMSNKPDTGENEEEPQEEGNITYTEALDNTLQTFNERHEINSNLHYTFLVPDSKKQDVFDVDIYYVSKNKCYIKSEYLDLDKTYDSNDLKEFLLDLYEKYTPRVVALYSASDELLDNYIIA